MLVVINGNFVEYIILWFFVNREIFVKFKIRRKWIVNDVKVIWLYKYNRCSIYVIVFYYFFILFFDLYIEVIEIIRLWF